MHRDFSWIHRALRQGHVLTETPLKAIGIILGGKDHSTVKYGVEKITAELKTDETLSNTINIIKKKINPA